MRNFRKIYAVIMSMMSLGIMTGCSDNSEPTPPSEPINLSRSETEIVKAQSDFAIKMLNIEVSEAPGSNFGLSPFCVQQALSMLGNGVSDADRAQYAAAFGLDGVDDLNALNVRLNESMPLRDPSNVSVQIANGMWLNSNYAVKQTFVDAMRDVYRSDASSYDFANVNIADIANGWISSKTKNGINGLIPDKYNRNDNVVFVLANALCFNGKWQTKFDVAQTKPLTFSDSYGKQGKEVPMMHNKQEIYYYGAEKSSMAWLPFGNGSYRMLVILPDLGVTVEDVLADLSDKAISEAWEQSQQVSADVYLPKFAFSAKSEITQEIVKAGVPLKSVRYANLSDAVVDVFTYHGFSIKVDEEGAELKAASAVSGMDTAPGPLPAAELKVDRPFIYAVCEMSSGAMLGLGVINDPLK